MTFNYLEDAKVWLQGLIESMSDGGTWGIPRAATVYRIDKTRKVFVRVVGAGDETTEFLLTHMGWSVEDGKPKTERGTDEDKAAGNP